MAKENKASAKIPTRKILMVIIIVLLVLSAGILLFRFFISSKPNKYVVGNKYYGFQLQAPKNWIAKENTIYSENTVSAFLAECKNNKSNNSLPYQIGEFRFESQRYPDGFGDSGYPPAGLSSGAILDVTVNCLSGIDNSLNGNYITNVSVADVRGIQNSFDSPEFGKTERISLIRNNLQYIMKEYVFVSPADKLNDQKIREDYAGIFNAIVSSFKFTSVK